MGLVLERMCIFGGDGGDGFLFLCALLVFLSCSWMRNHGVILYSHLPPPNVGATTPSLRYPIPRIFANRSASLFSHLDCTCGLDLPLD